MDDLKPYKKYNVKQKPTNYNKKTLLAYLRNKFRGIEKIFDRDDLIFIVMLESVQKNDLLKIINKLKIKGFSVGNKSFIIEEIINKIRVEKYNLDKFQVSIVEEKICSLYGIDNNNKDENIKLKKIKKNKKEINNINSFFEPEDSKLVLSI